MPRSSIKTQRVVVMYTEQHLTLEEIGRLIGMTRQAVRGRLQKAGISAKLGEWAEVICSYCGQTFQAHRRRWRRSRRLFCCAEHYYASRENPDYSPWRPGQRLARAIVAQYFDLQPEHVVHHHNGSNRDNDKSNLAVFASQSDHIKHHHGSAVLMLWDGRSA